MMPKTLLLLFLGLGLLIAGCPRYDAGERTWHGVRFGKHRVINPRPVTVNMPSRKPGIRYLHLLALGDQGSGWVEQQRIAWAMARFAGYEPIDMLLTVGDNFYPYGVASVNDPQWVTKFERMYRQPSLAVPFYASLGNHDYYGKPEAQVAYTKKSNCLCRCDANRQCHCRPKVPERKAKCWIMPAFYYSTDLLIDGKQRVHLVALDTNTMGSILKKSSYRRQLRWLEQNLKRHRNARWTIVYGHHPIYSYGERGNNPVLRRLLLPILNRYKVDLYIAGHDHDLQLIKPKPYRGVHHLISGGGSKSRDVTWGPDTLYAATNLGFVSLRISVGQLVVRFLDARARTGFALTLNKR